MLPIVCLSRVLLLVGCDVIVCVQTLDLSWNGLGSAPSPDVPSPLRLLCKGLTLNTSLTHLSLANNNINAEEGAELNKALTFNSTLRYALRVYRIIVARFIRC